jgi:hypothetical protein
MNSLLKSRLVAIIIALIVTVFQCRFVALAQDTTKSPPNTNIRISGAVENPRELSLDQ